MSRLDRGGYIVSMNTSEHITLRDALLLNHVHVGQMDGMVFGTPFHGELLECTVERLPICQLTIRAPAHHYGDYVYELSMENAIDEILEEIHIARREE